MGINTLVINKLLFKSKNKAYLIFDVNFFFLVLLQVFTTKNTLFNE